MIITFKREILIIFLSRLAWRMKAFSSNISVTVVNRRQYDKSLPKELKQV